jgi:hypothetical protein
LGGWAQTYIVDEPDQRDNKQTEAVVLEDKLVRGLGISHRVAAKLLGLLELKSDDEEHEREDDTNSQAGSPDGAVVNVASGSGHDI